MLGSLIEHGIARNPGFPGFDSARLDFGRVQLAHGERKAKAPPGGAQMSATEQKKGRGAQLGWPLGRSRAECGERKGKREGVLGLGQQAIRPWGTNQWLSPFFISNFFFKYFLKRIFEHNQIR